MANLDCIGLYTEDRENSYFCTRCTENELCKEIKEKYKITNRDDELIFLHANEFVKDIFNAGWSHHYSMRDYAKMKGYGRKVTKGIKKEKWVISIKEIYEMMLQDIPYFKTTPLYKKHSGGFLYGKKK